MIKRWKCPNNWVQLGNFQLYSCDWIIWMQRIKMQNDVPCFLGKIRGSERPLKRKQKCNYGMPEATGKTEFKQRQCIKTGHHHSAYHFLQTKPLKISVRLANKSPGSQTDGTLVLVLVAGQVTVLLFAWGEFSWKFDGKAFYVIYLSGIKYIGSVLYRCYFLVEPSTLRRMFPV